MCIYIYTYVYICIYVYIYIRTMYVYTSYSRPLCLCCSEVIYSLCFGSDLEKYMDVCVCVCVFVCRCVCEYRVTTWKFWRLHICSPKWCILLIFSFSSVELILEHLESPVWIWICARLQSHQFFFLLFAFPFFFCRNCSSAARVVSCRFWLCAWLSSQWHESFGVCNTLQHTAAHCNTLQHTATHCNKLQHTATVCNTLQHTATHCNTL